jgi:hypothetical protein
MFEANKNHTPMAFNGNEGSIISLNDTADLTANFRATISSGDTIAMFVGRNKLLDILNQHNCMGIRIYYGLDKQGEKKLILVGALSNEDDMEKGIIVDELLECPTHCSTANSLNS